MDNRQQLIREMLARADMRLQAQQQLAIAADARAMQFVAACVAGASLIVSIGGDQLASAHYVVAAVLIISAVFAFWAAKPIEWHAPGMLPSSFDEDIDRDVPISDVLEELSRHLEVSINENKDILAENARSLRLAAVAAIMAPLFGLVSKLISG